MANKLHCNGCGIIIPSGTWYSRIQTREQETNRTLGLMDYCASKSCEAKALEIFWEQFFKTEIDEIIVKKEKMY